MLDVCLKAGIRPRFVDAYARGCAHHGLRTTHRIIATSLVAGAAWGAYSLLGRRSQSPLADTASSFLLAAPFGAALALVAAPTMGLQISGTGLAYAAASGALASGGGYAAWYAVLPRMSATRAGTIQLAVPVLAALAGTAILGEPVSLRLVASGSAILGGIGLALSAKSQLRH